jgi:hypothetical protein
MKGSDPAIEPYEFGGLDEGNGDILLRRLG